MDSTPEKQQQPKPEPIVTSGIVPHGRRAGDSLAAFDFAGRDELFPAEVTSVTARQGPPIGTMLRQRKWLIVVLFILIAGGAIPPIWLFVEPTYESTAVVRVRPVATRIVFKTEDNAMVPMYQSYLNTQVSIIRSSKIMDRVLGQAKIRASYWYSQEGRSLLRGSVPPLERLRDDLKVQPRPQTELIDVSIGTARPGDAKTIVDTVVNEYMTYIGETARSKEAEVLDTLRAERARRQEQIEGLINQKFDLSKGVGAVDPEQLRSQLSTDVSRLEAEKEQVRRSLANTNSQLARMPVPSSRPSGAAATAPATRPTLPAPDHRYSNDAEWRKLNIDARMAQRELERAKGELREAHPRMKELQANVEFAEGLLHERETQLQAEWQSSSAYSLGPEAWRERMLQPAGHWQPTTAPTLFGLDGRPLIADRAALEALAEQQQQTLKMLDMDITARNAKLANAGDIAQKIAAVDEKIKQNREVYEAVRTRIEEKEMESKAPAQIEIASDGLEPTKPARDRRILLTVMALAGALMTGFAAAYLRGSMDTTIRGAGDVQQTVQAPFLGQVRQISAADDPIMETSPALVESVRMIRTSLLERLSNTQSPVVLMTSPLSQSGKTSVAVLLSKSLALLGKKVLLVEADLRRPSLSKRLGIEWAAGLAAVLAGVVDDGEAIIRVSDGAFDLLLAGDRPAHCDDELLGNGQLSAFLRRCKKKYDYVLLDGPPVLPVADGRILARQADSTVMVLRSSHCRRAEATQAYAFLSAAGGRLLGTVLVGGPLGDGDGYGYDYHGYYALPPREAPGEAAKASE
jgi:capsular exopolysaccharide synthesis family protein